MQRIRDSIKNDCFPEFVKKFVQNYYSNEKNHENKKQFEEMKNSDDGKKSDEDSADILTEKAQTKRNKVKIPDWVVNSLNAVNINVLEGLEN